MMVIGLTGGIGAGKSTVAAMLAERGAVIVDTDVIARQAIEIDGPAYHAVIDRFGPEVVAPDGSIDRPALAGIVFNDEGARHDLNSIVHPAVRQAVNEKLEELAGTDSVVVLDVPLLVEAGNYPTAGVIVVDSPEDLAVGRLTRQRGMQEADVRRRLAAQATRAERLAHADFVIVNDGSLADLRDQTSRAWVWIQSQPSR